MQKLSPSAICPMTGESANSQKMERVNGRANLARISSSKSTMERSRLEA